VGRCEKQEAPSKNTQSSHQSGSSSDTSNVEIAFVTRALVAKVRSEENSGEPKDQTS